MLNSVLIQVKQKQLNKAKEARRPSNETAVKSDIYTEECPEICQFGVGQKEEQHSV